MKEDFLKNQSRLPRWYGRRRSQKLSFRRQHLIDHVLPELRVTIPSGLELINLGKLFPNTQKEIWLEIGFGAGEHLAKQANQNPKVGFIGFDPFLNGVASLLFRLESGKIKNVRIFDDDVRLILNHFPEKSISRVYILFSDPWPKRRHHKRRLIQDEIINLLAHIVIDGGHIVFASDHMGFVRWTLEKFLKNPSFLWLADCKEDWSMPPSDWVETRYEEKARSKGLQIAYLTFLRLGRT